MISKITLPAGSLKGKTMRTRLPDIHMSYPYTFEHTGRIYCVPETAQAREVALYAAEASLNTWKKTAVLIKNLPAGDATLIQYNQTWWLFCGHRDENPLFNLFLWRAPSLEGPWLPHPANPVKSNIRSSRPAGTPFIHQGVLYRPAQDCSGTYGKRVVINKVLTLNLETFHEEPAATLEADPAGPYLAGLHTLSAAGDCTLIDGKRAAFYPRAFSA